MQARVDPLRADTDALPILRQRGHNRDQAPMNTTDLLKHLELLAQLGALPSQRDDEDTDYALRQTWRDALQDTEGEE